LKKRFFYFFSHGV